MSMCMQGGMPAARPHIFLFGRTPRHASPHQAVHAAHAPAAGPHAPGGEANKRASGGQINVVGPLDAFQPRRQPPGRRALPDGARRLHGAGRESRRGIAVGNAGKRGAAAALSAPARLLQGPRARLVDGAAWPA